MWRQIRGTHTQLNSTCEIHRNFRGPGISFAFRNCSAYPTHCCEPVSLSVTNRHAGYFHSISGKKKQAVTLRGMEEAEKSWRLTWASPLCRRFWVNRRSCSAPQNPSPLLLRGERSVQPKQTVTHERLRADNQHHALQRGKPVKIHHTSQRALIHSGPKHWPHIWKSKSVQCSLI